MLIYSATVSVTGLAFIPIMGYMGTVYGIVAQVSYMVWEKVYLALTRNHTTTCLTKSHARPSKCCTTYAELGAWALGSFASAF